MTSHINKQIFSLSNIAAIVAIIVSIVSVIYSYKTSSYTKEANNIAVQQKDITEKQIDISQQQTDILDRQTQIQENSLKFEQNKHRTDTAQMYREKINNLYDKIYSEEIKPMYIKLKSGEIVQNLENLDRFIDNIEDIGMLYCDGKIKVMDLRSILKQTIEPICGNKQVYDRYRNSKSGFAGMCKTLFPGSTVMAKRANPDKCTILRE